MKNKFSIALALLMACLVTVTAYAVTPPSPYLTGSFYFDGGVPAGVVSPAPTGQNNYLATLYTYDSNGRLASLAKGSFTSWPTLSPASTAQSPQWSPSLNPSTYVTYSYDGNGHKIMETLAGSDGVVTNVTQYSYDQYDRLMCTAVRMNPAAFGSLPDACTLGPTGPNGFDRITKNSYDNLNHIIEIRRAVGTNIEEAYATYTYTTDGLQESATDADGNLSHFSYDGFDRLWKWNFPSKTTVNTYSTTDYEQYGYDANSNRNSLRKRDGSMISYSYDALNRMTLKDVPGGTTNDVTYGYDLRGFQTSATFVSSGQGVTNAFDGFGCQTSSTINLSGAARTVSHQCDQDGNRIRVTHPDGNYFQYGYDGLNRLSTILENGSASILGQSYYPSGLRYSQSRSGVTTSYNYEKNERLSGVTDDLVGTASDVTTTFAYNPANQILTRMRTNDVYAYAIGAASTTNYTPNGLNQYASVGGVSFGYDLNGNLTSDGYTTYNYDAENRLTSASGAHSATLTYDPLGRLFQVAGSSNTTQFLYDGDELIAEYNDSGTLLRRYVHGPANDDPVIWYEGAGVSSSARRSLQVDHQGSIVSVADALGNTLNINTYDEYGVPGNNVGRFQYTGQAWIPELGMDYYKARIYNPSLGRFMQTDPIGYKDDMDLYSYVGNDPMDRTDPTGTFARGDGFTDDEWKKFNAAQQAAAKDMDKRADKLEKQADKLDAKGKEGGSDLRTGAANLRAGAADLKGDTKKANMVDGATMQQVNDGKCAGGAACAAIGGNTMWVNKDSNLWKSGNTGALDWVAGHESLHSGAGLTDVTSKGALSYSGNAAFKELQGTPEGYTKPDNLMDLVYPGFWQRH